MPRKKKEVESAGEEVELSDETIEQAYAFGFSLNKDFGRADLNENFTKIEDAINELKNG